MTVEVVRDRRGLVDLRPQWQDLLERSRDASPYLTWEWADAWLRVFGRGDRLHVLVVRRGGRVLAVAPLLRCGGLGRLPPVYVGLGQEAADYGGALLGEDPALSGPVLAGHLLAMARRGAGVVLTRLPPDGDVLPALDDAVRARPGVALRAMYREPYPYLDLSALPDPARHVSRAWKRNDVRRRVRRLSERATVEFVAHRSPRADPTALADFFRLHDARWSQKAEAAGHGPAGLFASTEGREFLARVALAADEAGWLRLSFVDVDGRPVVGRFGYQMAGTYYGVKSAFDPTWAEYGPGHMAVGFLLQQAVDDGLRRFDFMRGAGAHKDAWAGGSRDVGYWALTRAGRLGQVQLRQLRAVLAWRTRRRFRARDADQPAGPPAAKA